MAFGNEARIAVCRSAAALFVGGGRAPWDPQSIITLTALGRQLDLKIWLVAGSHAYQRHPPLHGRVSWLMMKPGCRARSVALCGLGGASAQCGGQGRTIESSEDGRLP